MSAHTPGPMVFDEEQGEVVMRVNGEKVRVCIPYARRTGSVVYGGAALGAEMQANGRLFAAAPELLAALKEAEALLNHGDFSNGNTHPDGYGPDEGSVLAGRLVGRIRAAIAKAEGK